MARGLTSNLAAEFDKAALRPVYFAKFEFPGGDVRFWSGEGNKTFNSEVYTGLGDLAGVAFPQENSGNSPQGAVFTLSGIPSTTTALAQQENYRNAAATVWIGARDGSGNIIVDPYQQFKGLMDVMTMDDDGETASVSINCEGYAYGVGPQGKRYTDEQQQRDYPGDLGLQYVAGLQDKEILWGVESAAKPAPRPPWQYPPEFEEEYDDHF